MQRTGRRSWWRTWTWKKALMVGGGSLGGLILVIVIAGFAMYSTTSIPAALASEQQQNSIVYYSDGTTEMGTIGSTNRTDLTLNQIPVTLQDAFLASEDRNFYHEGGVSPTGILRATLSDVTSGGSSLNGGSTITQEFVRNYYGLGLQQTATRKIKEIIISEKLAGEKSKQWILQNYLNVVYLGADSYGIQAASETYFGKPVSQLTIGEQAILAGLPQAPSAYPLLQYKTSLETRWQYVMAQMVRDGFISQAQASAQKFPTLLTWADPARGQMASNINPANPKNVWEPYILNSVETELTSQDKVTQGQLNAGGMKIVTNISLPKEQALYNAVNTTLSSSSLQNEGSQFSKLPPWVMTGAEAQDPSNGAIVAVYPGKGQNQSSSDCLQNNCDVNSVTQNTEQVGSSFKPYVLSAAVQQGMNVQSSIMDTSPYACIAPASMGSTVFSQPITPAIYKQPGNFSGCPGSSSAYQKIENDSGEIIGKHVGTGTGTGGTVAGAAYYSDNAQDALAMSSNVAFTDLIHKTGTTAVANIAASYGVNVGPGTGGANLTTTQNGGLEGQVGMALGEAPMTVEDQATMIATIDDNGTYHTPHLIQYWQDTTTGTKNNAVVSSHPVLTPAQDSQVQYAMEMTTVNGTAKGLVQMSQNGRQVLGKTGTTTSNHSGFFIGGIPQFAMAVGMFLGSHTSSSDNLGMLDSQNAANIYPTMIWNAFANAAYGNTAPANFQSLDTAGTTKWDLLGPVPAAPKAPKPKQTQNPNKNKQPSCGGFLGLGGGNGNGGNCTPTAQPTTQPTTQPTANPQPTCGGLLGGCQTSSPPPGAPSSPPVSPHPGKGNGG
jgi:membrane peptidoglycan carboxypeptidase